MEQAVLVFLSQALMVCLLAMQSLNTNNGLRVAAAITSTAIGVFGYYATAVISQARLDGVGGLVWWAYILAGPVGAVAGMTMQPKLRSFINSRQEVNRVIKARKNTGVYWGFAYPRGNGEAAQRDAATDHEHEACGQHSQGLHDRSEALLEERVGERLARSKSQGVAKPSEAYESLLKAFDRSERWRQ